MSILRSELQSCVRYMRCHSERTMISRKRLGRDGSPSRPTFAYQNNSTERPGGGSLPDQRLDVGKQFVGGNQNLFARREILYRNLRPFVAEEQRDVCAEVFGALELAGNRSEEHTSELQSRFGISYAVFC